MIEWYIKAKKILHSIHKKAIDALRHCENGEAHLTKKIANYMKSDYEQLQDHWNSMFPEESFSNLGRHIGFAEQKDFSDIIELDLPAMELKLDQHLIEFQKSLSKKKSPPYVAEERITGLSEIVSKNFSTIKLIQLLREINTAYDNDAYLTIGILLRAVIDHVPPIFECITFAEVSNNYRGTKSFKTAMRRLNDSLRNWADSYLHVQIREKESLPTINQVDFRAEVDALLSEVSRLL